MKFSFERKDILYGISLLGFILFFFTKIEVLAVLSALVFIFGVLDESWDNIRENGWKSEAKELGLSILIALGIWYGATFLLGTSSPFNAVVSCSMLPNLERGDVIILTSRDIQLPSIQLDSALKDSFLYESHYVCTYCKDPDGLTRVCQVDPFTNEEVRGQVVNYNCGFCVQTFDNGTFRELPCAKGVYVNGVYFDATAQNNTILVYKPLSGDILSRIGDIIHRGVAEVQFDDGTRYYLIKGDNNPMFDSQMGLYSNSGYLTNNPPERSQIVGRSLIRIPVVGYIKLVAFGQVANPENCKFRITYQ